MDESGTAVGTRVGTVAATGPGVATEQGGRDAGGAGSLPPAQDYQPVRVDATPEALAMLRRLAAEHGPLLIHQSGGCCDGSSPMCYPRGDFLIGDNDVLLGVLGGPAGPDPMAGAAIHEVGPPAAQAQEHGRAAVGPSEVPVYIGGAQFAYWSHTRLTIDLVPGRGAGFSLEAPEGYRFLTRSRLFTDAEADALEAAGPPHRGPL